MRRFARRLDAALARFCRVSWPLPPAPASLDEAQVALLTWHLERKA